MAHHLRGRMRAFGLLAALVVALVVPASVFADTGGGGGSINPAGSRGAAAEIEGVTLDGKLMATIRVAVVCDELTYFDWETWEEFTTTEGRLSADGQLLQAQGRSIAAASGFAGPIDVTCDGSTVNHVSVAVIAQNLPLRRGDALVGATIWVSAGAEGSESYASTGPVAVKLK